MLFTNLQLYRLPQDWRPAPGMLEADLARQPLIPVPAGSRQTRGWVAPAPDGALVRSVESMLVCLGNEAKVLPGTVIKREIEERAAAIEREKGFAPGRKMRRELKEQVINDLLPRAFTKRSTTRAWLDPKSGWMGVDASSASRAEEVVEVMRNCLGGDFAVTLPEVQCRPSDLMTLWMRAGEVPEPFAIGDACELYGVEDDKPSIRFVRHGLQDPAVRTHVEHGRRCSKLNLTWRDRISFVLTDRFELRRLSFLGVMNEPVDRNADTLDQEFALFESEIRVMLTDLLALFTRKD